MAARPLSCSSTKRQALTDRSPLLAVLGDWGVMDRSLQPSPDL